MENIRKTQNLKMNLKEFFNWLFPFKCIVCNCETNENSVFCSDCFSKLTFIDYPFCQKCGKMLETSFCEDEICNSCQMQEREFDIARALFKYDNVSKDIIMHIKKQADSNVAKVCARLIYARYKNLFENVDYIIPVPSHWTRILRRGYNPPSIVAAELSKISQIPVCKAIKRIKKTKYQKNKTIQERRDNVKDAFLATKDLHDKSVILIDDVFTTGATLNACSLALKQNECEKVLCLTIATT